MQGRCTHLIHARILHCVICTSGYMTAHLFSGEVVGSQRWFLSFSSYTSVCVCELFLINAVI